MGRRKSKLKEIAEKNLQRRIKRENGGKEEGKMCHKKVIKRENKDKKNE